MYSVSIFICVNVASFICFNAATHFPYYQKTFMKYFFFVMAEFTVFTNNTKQSYSIKRCDEIEQRLPTLVLSCDPHMIFYLFHSHIAPRLLQLKAHKILRRRKEMKRQNNRMLVVAGSFSHCHRNPEILSSHLSPQFFYDIIPKAPICTLKYLISWKIRKILVTEIRE